MYKYLAAQYSGKPFETFGSAHMSALTAILVFNAVMVLILKPSDRKRVRRVFRIAFACFTGISFICFFIWAFYSGYWSVKYALPLQICDISVILSIIMLLKGNQFIYEITYFWGISGGLHALLTPGIAPYNYPHYIFFSFFILHGVVVTSVLYMTIVEGCRPAFSSVWKTLLITNGYAVVVFAVNLLIDSNYMFLMEKPPSPAITDFLGPWPWYILLLEFVAAASFVICYIPTALIKRFPVVKHPLTSFNKHL